MKILNKIPIKITWGQKYLPRHEGLKKYLVKKHVEESKTADSEIIYSKSSLMKKIIRDIMGYCEYMPNKRI